MLAFDDLKDAAFCAALGTAAYDAGQHAVTVHRVAQIVPPDEEIAFHPGYRSIGNEEGIAFAMGDDSSGNKIGIVSGFRCRGGRWLLVFWPALRESFFGSRFAVLAFCRGSLSFFCAR